MPDDPRTARQVMRDYERFMAMRARLVRDGVVSDDATPEQVIAALRKLVPANIFANDAG